MESLYTKFIIEFRELPLDSQAEIAIRCGDFVRKPFNRSPSVDNLFRLLEANGFVGLSSGIGPLLPTLEGVLSSSSPIVVAAHAFQTEYLKASQPGLSSQTAPPRVHVEKGFIGNNYGVVYFGKQADPSQ